MPQEGKPPSPRGSRYRRTKQSNLERFGKLPQYEADDRFYRRRQFGALSASLADKLGEQIARLLALGKWQEAIEAVQCSAAAVPLDEAQQLSRRVAIHLKHGERVPAEEVLRAAWRERVTRVDPRQLSREELHGLPLGFLKEFPELLLDVLERLEIRTLGELLAHSQSELLQMRGLGVDSLTSLVELLEQRGWHLRYE